MNDARVASGLAVMNGSSVASGTAMVMNGNGMASDISM